MMLELKRLAALLALELAQDIVTRRRELLLREEVLQSCCGETRRCL